MAFSDLQMKVAAEAGVQAIHASMAKLQDFAHNYSELEGQKGDGVAVPVYNLSASALFDETNNNYASGTENCDGAYVQLSCHYVKSAKINDKQLATTDINWLRDMATAEADVIGRAINAYAFGLLSDSDITLSATLSVGTKAGVASLYETCQDNDINPNDAVVVLDPENFAKVMSLLDSNVYGGAEAIREGRIPGLYGFRSFVCSTFLPSGVKGAIISRDALGFVSKYLEPMGGAYPDAWKATDENGMTIGFRSFQDLATGNRFLACEALVGGKVILPTKIVKLV